MKWALGEDGQRILATWGARAEEPGSHWPVIAKCGHTGRRHHWARRPGGVPDAWSEPETPWHRDWKERLVPDNHQEYTFKGGPSGYHRADAIGKGGIVVEFQHSSISPQHICDREEFYLANAASMIWVVDAQNFNLRWNDDKDGTEVPSLPTVLKRGRQKTAVAERDFDPEQWFDQQMRQWNTPELKGLTLFRWLHPHQTWFSALCQTFWDTGSDLIEVLHIYDELPCLVWGRRLSYESFYKCFGVPPGAEAPTPQPGGLTREICVADKAQRLHTLKQEAYNEFKQLVLPDLNAWTEARFQELDRLEVVRLLELDRQETERRNLEVQRQRRWVNQMMYRLDLSRLETEQLLPYSDKFKDRTDSWWKAFSKAHNAGLVEKHGAPRVAILIERSLKRRREEKKKTQEQRWAAQIQSPMSPEAFSQQLGVLLKLGPEAEMSPKDFSQMLGSLLYEMKGSKKSASP